MSSKYLFLQISLIALSIVIHTMSHDLKVGGVVSVLVVIAIIVLAGALVHRLVAIMVIMVVMVIMVIKTGVILLRILQMLYFHTSHIMVDV